MNVKNTKHGSNAHLTRVVLEALASVNNKPRDLVLKTRAILGLDGLSAPETTRGSPASAVPTSKPRTTVSNTKTKTTLASQPTKVTTHVRVYEESASNFAAEKCRSFAIEVVNVTLQQLASDHVKPRTVQNQDEQATGLRREQLIGNTSPVTTQLRSVPSNKVTNRQRSTKANGAKTLTRTADDDQYDRTETIIGCARAAFEYIRLERLASSCKVLGNDWKLENGLLAFIARLLALQYLQGAIEELHGLNQILQARFMSLTDAKSCTSPHKSVKTTQLDRSRRLADLLHFSNIPNEKTSLTVIIHFQILVLKAIAQHDRRYVDDTLLARLKFTSASSPANLLFLLAQHKDTADLAARHLETIAQLIFVLCPSVSSKHDTPEVAQGITVESAGLCLQLQTTAFKIQLRWMECAHHTGDIDLEICKPFLRCLKAYNRRCDATLCERYRVASECAQDLLQPIKVLSPAFRPGASWAEADQLLSKMAAEAGQTSEAVSHLSNQIVGIDRKDILNTKQIGVLARLAVLKLTSKRTNPGLDGVVELDDLITLADQAIAGKISDTGIMIDELLKVGQAILPLLSAAAKTPTPNPAETNQLFSFFEKLILLFDHFFKAEADNSDTMTDMTSVKVKQKLETSAYMAIKTVIFMASVEQYVPILGLTRLDHILQTSLLLCANLERPRMEADGEMNANESTVLAISNAYWIMFNRHKSSGMNDFEAFTLAKRSCSCLSGQHKSLICAGQLPNRLLKLGMLLSKTGDVKAARETLGMVIESARQLGVLEEIVRRAGRDTMAPILESYKEADVCSQALEALLHLDTTNQVIIDNCSNAFFDMHELDKEARCALLEMQLMLCTRKQKSRTKSDKCRKIEASILPLLLELYDEHQFPIRRQHTATRILWLALNYSDSVSEHITTASSECFLNSNVHDLKHDRELAALFTHLQCSGAVAIGLMKDDNREAQYEKAAAVWTSLIQSCVSLTQLQSHVGDIASWCGQLGLLSDYLHMHGHYNIELKILSMLISVYELEGSAGACAAMSTRSRVGRLYLELDNTTKAGLYLLKNAELKLDASSEPEAMADSHAALAAYYHALGNDEKCTHHIDVALEYETQISKMIRSDATGPQKTINYCKTADLVSIRAYILWDNKFTEEALELQAKAMVILQRAWKSLRISDSSRLSPKGKFAAMGVESVNDALSKLTIDNDSSTSTTRHGGPSYWIIGPRLCDAFIRLSGMSYWSSIYEDSLHYAEQALEIAEALQSKALLGTTLVRLSDLLCRSGAIEDSRQHLCRARQIYGEGDDSSEAIWHKVALGQVHHRDGNWADELIVYQAARESTLRLIANHATPDSVSMTQSSVTPSEGQHSISRRGKVAVTRLITHPKTKTMPATAATRTSAARSPKLESLASMLARLQAEAHLAQGDVKKAVVVLSEARVQNMNTELLVQNNSTLARTHIMQALSDIAVDPAFSMLTDSIISIPSALRQRRRGSSSLSTPATTTVTRVSKTKLASNTPRDAGLKITGSGDSHDLAEIFLKAYELIAESSGKLARQCSVATMIQSSLASVTAAMLTSFAFHGHADAVPHPGQVAWSIEIPHIATSARERAYIELEQKRSISTLKMENTNNLRDLSHVANLGLSQFQSNFIDIIPSNWTTISMYLDEQREHMYITRYEAERTPFLLRLPLSRETAEDLDDVTFTFDDAKEELHAIVDASDATVHAARDDVEEMKQKGAKSKWWADREALNDRLKELLLNIENMWFGGFRGIFSSHQRDVELLARFQRSFENILDKHLPSRQKPVKAKKQKKVVLDARVLDLFIGLTHAPSGDVDVDEALTDLLYYVVDILQFNGEANAYDEIDFDSLVVETQDALQSYHEACTEKKDQQTRHTILILDKQLHAFPWESLPCLEQRSVSRLSSLYDLRERILSMRQQPEAPESGFHIPITTGTYILNPSRDLAKTQARFEKPLSALRSWSSMINQPPSEDSFLKALTPPSPPTSDPSSPSSSLLLYFGHGSGAQYVRSRRIKRLRTQRQANATPSVTCNTTLLFGCSSASLREVSEFEPYGTPKTYLAAGAPALLGSLWDVTDGDCDAFAGGVLERWGLLEKGSCAQVDSGKRKKGRGAKKAKQVGEQELEGEKGRKMCLNEAVAKSRGECYLKYLNGAAMVVYGVPVFLAK